MGLRLHVQRGAKFCPVGGKSKIPSTKKHLKHTENKKRKRLEKLLLDTKRTSSLRRFCFCGERFILFYLASPYSVSVLTSWFKLSSIRFWKISESELKGSGDRSRCLKPFFNNMILSISQLFSAIARDYRDGENGQGRFSKIEAKRRFKHHGVKIKNFSNKILISLNDVRCCSIV